MINFNNTYTSLGEDFYSKENAHKFSNPELITINKSLANELEIEQIDEQEMAQVFSGQKILPGSSMISQAYAGHQFGYFVPQLGDGRALMLGETKGYDIQLKGSGRTFFSRRGDGLSPMGPVLREYLVSEAMNNLGIATTRSLAIVKTNDPVFREEALPGGILTRISKGLTRVGTFEYFSSRNQTENVKRLADYCIEKFYPTIKESDDKYFDFFKEVSKRLIKTVNAWLGVGFIHGVMNTDNTSICGETIDYGPCAFMDYFRRDKVYSFIDKNGRYAYQNQPLILKWNLSIFAGCLIPLIDDNSDKAIEKLQAFIDSFDELSQKEYLTVFSKKLGISNPVNEDLKIIEEFLFFLEKNELDFTNSFRKLLETEPFFEKADEFQQFNQKRLARIEDINDAYNLMRKVNPAIIPRNHLIEKAISDVYESDSYEFFFKLNEVFRKPYEIAEAEFSNPPKNEEIVTNTFCGT